MFTVSIEYKHKWRIGSPVAYVVIISFDKQNFVDEAGFAYLFFFHTHVVAADNMILSDKGNKILSIICL